MSVQADLFISHHGVEFNFRSQTKQHFFSVFFCVILRTCNINRSIFKSINNLIKKSSVTSLFLMPISYLIVCIDICCQFLRLIDVSIIIPWFKAMKVDSSTLINLFLPAILSHVGLLSILLFVS